MASATYGLSIVPLKLGGIRAAHNAVNSDRSSVGVADTAEWDRGSIAAVDIAVDRNCSSAGAIGS